MNAKEYAALISSAKAAIDNGFSRVGKRLDPANASQRALMLLASRAVAIGNALVVLAQQSLANEALPLLRSLLEISVTMRWIAAADGDRRAQEALEEGQKSDWAGLWQTSRLRQRMREYGFPENLQERVQMFCYDHLHGNAQGLPWGHVFEDNKNPGISADELLKIAAFASGHVVKALEVRWPGQFEGAEQLWEKAKVS
jgi:hypothetical protein